MNPLKSLLGWYFRRDSLPYWCILCIDGVIVFLNTILAFWIFRRSGILFDDRMEVLYTALFYAVVSCLGARMFRTYSGILRYSSFVDLMQVAYANSVNLILLLLITSVMHGYDFYAFAALSPIETCVAFLLATLTMWAMRITVKTLFDVAFNDKRLVNVLIYGAMSGGVGLAKNIQMQRPKKFRLKGFISHDKRAKHIQLIGQNVYNLDDDLEGIIKRDNIGAILVSPLRSVDFRNNQEIQNRLIGAGCKIYMTQMAVEAKVKNGQIAGNPLSDMRLTEVSVEDLLPRAEISIDMDSVAKLLRNQCILITGSAGSIGSEMVRQIASFKPAKMVLVDQAETPQHDIRLMMSKTYPDVEAHTIVASINHALHMENIFKTYRPAYVFHAAAYKHVPMMEDNPSEAVLNNILGTKVIADLSVKYGVKKFVMVSTDKAVNPTNVMGCSKRICEIYVQSLNKKLQEENKGAATQFVTTRFGNVLGSNGSVIPLFREQIKNGGPVTVTDERIVRFFMLIPEACELVLEAGTQGHGGEIFVFDMGQPVKIADLAKRMIALSGAKDVEIQYTGLREGEKLYEEVLNELEGTKPTFNEKIRIAQVREYDYTIANRQIEELIAISKLYDNMATVKCMKQIVPEYKSNNSVYEELDKEMRNEE